jgi:hypothetical protein
MGPKKSIGFENNEHINEQTLGMIKAKEKG